MTTGTDTLPKATEAERKTIGSLLLLPEVAPDIMAKLRAGDFTDEVCGASFRIIADFYSAGKPFDLTLITHELGQRHKFIDNTAGGWLLGVGGETTTAAHAEYYADLVAEAAAKRRVYLIATDAAECARNGSTASETINGLRSELDDLERRFGHRGGAFTIYSAAQLATEQFELSYLVDGILAEDQPCIVAGSKKCLKTSLLLDLSIALAAGGCFLGSFRTARSTRVLFCSGESGLATLQETANRICAAAGYHLSALNNFLLTPNLPRFDDASQLAEFERLLQTEDIEVVGIDPAYLCMPGGDAGNLFIQGELLRGISEVCQRQNVTLLVAHHTRKTTADPFAPPELADIAWAGFQEFARQWILVGRREQYEPGTGNHRLWLSVGGSAGHGGLWAVDVAEGHRDDANGRAWSVDVKKPDQARNDVEQRKTDARAQEWQRQLEGDREAVYRVLAKHPVGLTKTAIGDRAGIPNRRWPKVFAAMLDSGDLEPCEVKVSNQKRPREGYRLADREDA